MVLLEMAIYETGKAHIDDNLCKFIAFNFCNLQEVFDFIIKIKCHFWGDINDVDFIISFKESVKKESD